MLSTAQHLENELRFQKIIVAADGYSGGPDALCLAETLAADDAEIVLADSLPKGPALHASALTGYERVLREDAVGVLERRAPGRDLAVRVESLGGSALEMALPRLAQREGADLIVVGCSCNRSAAPQLLGHGTDEPLPCPVAVASDGYGHVATRPRIVGVAFDASPEAIAALALGSSLAKRLGARLDVRVVAVAGAPGQALHALSQEVDILVTGAPVQATLWRTSCPLIIVPRGPPPTHPARTDARMAANA